MYEFVARFVAHSGCTFLLGKLVCVEMKCTRHLD